MAGEEQGRLHKILALEQQLGTFHAIVHDAAEIAAMKAGRPVPAVKVQPEIVQPTPVPLAPVTGQEAPHDLNNLLNQAAENRALTLETLNAPTNPSLSTPITTKSPLRLTAEIDIDYNERRQQLLRDWKKN